MSAPTSEYLEGTRIVIRPEWRDDPAVETVYVVTRGDEGKRRVDIAPEAWDVVRDGRFRPTETVLTCMIRRVA